VPNVPNTDWLEVYYDGRDYTSMPVTVEDKSGNGVTGTPTSGVGFDTEYKAFTFDGGSYIDITDVGNPSGNWTHSVSFWVKPQYDGSANDVVFRLGPNENNKAVGFLYNATNITYYFYSNDFSASYALANKWYHITLTYDGNERIIYINGGQDRFSSTTGGGSLNLYGNDGMRIGINQAGSAPMTGSVANFRVFNRAITADEVWQLYAYQKEYFDVSPDVVAFKGGRLGIGTSEPGAVLDVRGDANFDSAITVIGTEITSFTGQHVCFPYGDMEQGLVVSANKNKYVSLNGVTTGLSAIRSDESLPIVSLSNASNDGSVFGVVHELETGGTTRNRIVGGVNTKTQKMVGDNRAVVNSLGEGAMWVANTNGNLVSGDYITTSNVAGYGQRQDDDILHNYTVAKITMDCDFNPQEVPVQVIKEELDSYGRIQWEDHPTETEKAYKIRYLDATGVQTDEANAVHIAAFVGCTYHCG